MALLPSQQLHYFERTQKIGEGTYGVVYKAFDRINNRVVALKIIKTDEQGISSTTLREVSMLRLLEHENIISLHYIIPHETFFCFVFEYLDQDLKAYMDSVRGVLHKSVIKNFTRQLLQALQYCHANCVMHRNLKPQNLLIDIKTQRLKLCDFGLARYHAIDSIFQTSVYTHEVVTLWYRPPELLLGLEESSVQTDMWGVGCIFAEMITKHALFPGDSDIDQLNKIFNIMGTPNERIWPGCTLLKGWRGCFPQFKNFRARSLTEALGLEQIEAELLSKCLLYDPPSRISAEDALKLQYFL